MREWVSDHLGERVTDPGDGWVGVIVDGVWDAGRFYWIVRGVDDGALRRVRIEDATERRRAG